MATYQAKPAEAAATRKWYVVDATNQPLGRLATKVASVLRGKHKPTYTPHMDCGDHVIVVNAEKVQVTGKKAEQSVFYWHTNYPGGIKGKSQGEIRAGAHPEEEFVRRDLAVAAVAALGEISALDRETLVATFWEEAAAVSGATLRKRRERAMGRLRDVFRRMYGFV